MHTWSLAIERAILSAPSPIALLIVLRIFKRWQLALAGATLGSFAICLFLTSTRPAIALYFSPSRAWELLLGACITVTMSGISFLGVQGRPCNWLASQ